MPEHPCSLRNYSLAHQRAMVKDDMRLPPLLLLRSVPSCVEFVGNPRQVMLYEFWTIFNHY